MRNTYNQAYVTSCKHARNINCQRCINKWLWASEHTGLFIPYVFFNRGVYPIANGKFQLLSSFLVPTRVSCKNQVILSVQLHICWSFYVVIVAPSVTMPSTAVVPTSSLSSDFYSWVMIWNANTCYLIFFKTIQHTMRLLNSDHWTEGKWHLSQQWCHYYHHNQKKVSNQMCIVHCNLILRSCLIPTSTNPSDMDLEGF